MRVDTANHNLAPLTQNTEKAPRLLVLLRCCYLAAAGALLSGCGVAQEPECEKYLDCMAHYNDVFEREGPALADYEENGACWQDAQTAELCKNNCIEATNDLIDALELAEEDLGPCA